MSNIFDRYCPKCGREMSLNQIKDVSKKLKDKEYRKITTLFVGS